MGREELQAIGLVLGSWTGLVGLLGLLSYVMRKLIDYENRQVTGASHIVSLDPFDPDLRRN